MPINQQRSVKRRRRAERVTRIASDRKLVGTAPTSIAVEDEFMLWLWHQAGTVDPDIDIAY